MDILYGIKLAVAAIIPLILGLTVQQIAKGWTARKLGDRYTLRSYNPKDYIDYIGTITIPMLVILFTQSLVLFGWCKPALINIGNIQKRKDRIIVYLSGSIANFFMILGWLFLTVIIIVVQEIFPQVKSFPFWDMLGLMAQAGIRLNIIFIAFSLLPLLPFDGGKIVEEFLPVKWAMNYKKIEPYSLYILLFIVFFTPFMGIWLKYIDYFINFLFIKPLIGLLN